MLKKRATLPLVVTVTLLAILGVVFRQSIQTLLVVEAIERRSLDYPRIRYLIQPSRLRVGPVADAAQVSESGEVACRLLNLLGEIGTEEAHAELCSYANSDLRFRVCALTLPWRDASIGCRVEVANSLLTDDQLGVNERWILDAILKPTEPSSDPYPSGSTRVPAVV